MITFNKVKSVSQYFYKTL